MKRLPYWNHALVSTAIAVAILLLTPVSSLCISLEDYKTRVDSSLQNARVLEETLQGGEVDETVKASFVQTIRAGFPAAERIEWIGGSVETSHDWLLQKIEELEKASEVKTHSLIIVTVREHLSAISFKLGEIQESAASGRTKDEDKQKLSEILRREEYQKPAEVEESWFQRALREFVEWFWDLWPKPKVNSPQAIPGFDAVSEALKIILFLALGGLLLFVIYKLAPLLFPKLKRSRRSKPKKRIILGEEIGENEGASDLFGEAERLARTGDIRGAIRKGYIALLCDLSDRRVIGLARHKTNRDYVRDVRSRRELHPRMKSVTDTFERHWYGRDESEKEDWTRFLEGCNETIRSI